MIFISCQSDLSVYHCIYLGQTKDYLNNFNKHYSYFLYSNIYCERYSCTFYIYYPHDLYCKLYKFRWSRSRSLFVRVQLIIPQMETYVPWSYSANILSIVLEPFFAKIITATICNKISFCRKVNYPTKINMIYLISHNTVFLIECVICVFSVNIPLPQSA